MTSYAAWHVDDRGSWGEGLSSPGGLKDGEAGEFRMLKGMACELASPLGLSLA